jgi:hypothetical protein
MIEPVTVKRDSIDRTKNPEAVAKFKVCRTHWFCPRLMEAGGNQEHREEASYRRRALLSMSNQIAKENRLARWLDA